MGSPMRHRVVFVLIDGLCDDVAQRAMGFMEGLVEANAALRAKVKCVLPSLSRPCYASIFTGSDPLAHGITTNDITHRLECPNVFDLLSQEGRSSAVVGYLWMSELFSRGPFDFVRDVEQDGNAQGITCGRFYFEDDFPDTHVFALAERMRVVNDPDLLVIHPMGCDYVGHQHGSSSRQYAENAGRIDFLLAKLVPSWVQEGYHVIVTADHGMNEHGHHGGTEEQVRMTPLYVLGPKVKHIGNTDESISQTVIAHLLCQLLDLSSADSMAALAENLQKAWFTASFLLNSKEDFQ